MRFNNQGLLSHIFSLSVRAQSGMWQNKIHFLSSQIWKNILFVGIVGKVSRKWTTKKNKYTWGSGQTSRIPLDSIIMSGKSFYIRINMVFKSQIFFVESSSDFISPVVSLRSPRILEGHMLADDNLIHFHRDFPT